MKEAKAQYQEFFVGKKQLTDEIDLLQLGQTDVEEYEYISYDKTPVDSKFNNWPT